jgi:hypothetical protein
MMYTPAQDELAIDALRRIKRADEMIDSAKYEINMERSFKAAEVLSEARLEILLAEAALRKIDIRS